MLETIRFNAEVADEAEGLHILEECEGFHAGAGNSVCRGSVGCYEGPCHDYLGGQHYTNAVLADFDCLPGARQLLALSRGTHLPESCYDGSRVQLDVNDSYFFDDAAGQIRSLWAVTVEGRSRNSLQVNLYTSLHDGEAAYREQVAEFLDEDDMNHGFAEPCGCHVAGVTQERLVLRALVPRTEHSLLFTYPETLCMCGVPLQSRVEACEYPGLDEHLDEVVDQIMGGLQPKAAAVLARLAPGWFRSLAELATSAIDIADMTDPPGGR
jgi:hypothetical protein